MNTGWLSPTAYENSSNTFFSHLWIVSASGFILFAGNTGTQTVKTFSSAVITGIVTGVEVKLYDTYGVSNVNAALSIQISNNGGSTFSSAKTTGAVGVTETGTNFTLGSHNNLWGLDWYGFTELNQLKVKGTESGGQTLGSRHIQIRIHYRDVESSLKLKGTKMHLKGGKFTIK